MGRLLTISIRRRLLGASAIGGVSLGLLAGAAAPACAQIAGERVPGEASAAFDDSGLVRNGLFDRSALDVDVLGRLRPELAVNPIDLGSYSVTPAVRAGFFYNSNVLAIDHGDSDQAFEIEPSVGVQSNWARNFVSAFARLDNLTWANHIKEDVTNYAVGTNDHVDLGAASALAAGAQFASLTEARDDVPSPQGAVKPEHYDLATVYLGGVQQLNRVRLVLNGDVKDYRYSNNSDETGALIYQRDRDLTQWDYSGRAEYALNAVSSVYAQLGGNTRNYHDLLPGEPARNSSGFDIGLGASFDLTHLLRGDLQVGYLDQTFVSHSYRPVSGLDLRGSVAFLLSPLTTITLSSAQQLGDAGVVGSAGYLQTIQSLQVDHEFVRNLILSANLGAEEDSIRGVSRRDFRPTAGVSARFMIDRSFGFVLKYQYLQDKSTGTLQGPSYDEQKLVVNLIYKL